MGNVWVKTRRDGLVRAADIVRIRGDGECVRVWRRTAGDTAPSAITVCDVPRRTPKLPGDFAAQLALLIAQYQNDFAVIEAVHQPSGWGWMISDTLAVRPRYYCATALSPDTSEPGGPEPATGSVESLGWGRFVSDRER